MECLKFARCSKILSHCKIMSTLAMWLDWQILSIIALYQNRLVACPEWPHISQSHLAFHGGKLLTTELSTLQTTLAFLQMPTWSTALAELPTFTSIVKTTNTSKSHNSSKYIVCYKILRISVLFLIFRLSLSWLRNRLRYNLCSILRTTTLMRNYNLFTRNCVALRPPFWEFKTISYVLWIVVVLLF